eukprot:858345-Karenia_brevis.AAC.1
MSDHDVSPADLTVFGGLLDAIAEDSLMPDVSTGSGSRPSSSADGGEPKRPRRWSKALESAERADK